MVPSLVAKIPQSIVSHAKEPGRHDGGACFGRGGRLRGEKGNPIAE